MSTIKIMVVEDECIEALDIRNTLESFGYEVPYMASRGDEAVAKAQEIKPDLVLMDIILRGEITGIEAASQIKKLDIPFIYLTAHSNEKTVEEAKLTEPYGYLLKPFNSNDLKHTIELALHKHMMENKLKESENRYRLLVESQKDFVVETDAKGRFTFVNPSFCELLGITEEEILGKTLLGFVDENYHESTVKSFRSSFSKPPFNGNHEVCIQTKNGNCRVSWSGQPVLDDEQKLIRIFAVGRDITQQKKLLTD